MGGLPIYLVSACTSGEEFVAAFRRYADKGGIFIPIAEPLPANRRGRFAMALTDGGVMIEGEAEVVASSKSPSPLYGRVGMTIRFVEPDEPSRIMLGELDKARLAPKPPVPSIPPRAAEVPTEPRPVPPAPSGRIDAANALAETVVIGDLTSLKDLGPPKAGPKFVIPSIPTSPRAKTPSTFPMVEARTRSPSSFPIAIDPAKSPSGPIAKVTEPPTQPMPFSATPRARTPTATPEFRTKAPTAPPEFRTKAQTAPPEFRTKAPTAPPDMFPRAKTATVPPERPRSGTLSPSLGRPKGGTMPPPLTTRDTQPVAVAPPPKLDPNDRRAESRTSLPPLEALKVGSTQAVAVVPPPQLFVAKNLFSEDDAIDTDTRRAAPPPARISGESQPLRKPEARPDTATGFGVVPEATIEVADVELDDDEVAAPPPPATPRAIAPEDSKRLSVPTPTSVTAAPQPTDEPTSLAALVKAAAMSKKSRGDVNPTLRGTPGKVLGLATPSGGAPVVGVPAAPIVAARAPSLPILEAEEPTDLTVFPVPDIRMTSVGLGVPPPRDTEMMDAAHLADPSDVETDVLSSLPTTQHVSVRPKPNVEEPTPSGDWTMTPGGPVAVPPDKAPSATDDWTITPDMAPPEGWAAMEAAGEQPESAPIAVRPVPLGPSKTKVIQAAVFAPEPDRIAEPKVQIDPTLMEPLTPMPLFDDDEPALLASPTSQPMMHQHHQMASHQPMSMPAPQFVSQSHMMANEMGMGIPTPQPFAPPPSGPLASATGPNPSYSDSNQRMVTDAGTGFFHDDHAQVRYPTGPNATVEDVGRRRRLVIIAISAVTAVAIGLVVLFVVIGGKKPAAPLPNRGSGSARAVAPIGSAAVEAPAIVNDAAGSAEIDPSAPTDPKAVVEDPKVVAPVVPVVPPSRGDGTCSVDIVTVPAGAEIVDDANKVIGTAPTKLPFPCAPVKLAFRKAGFVATVRTVTATPEGFKLRVGLAHTMLSVKVTSSPANASITVDGKAKGNTPGTMKLAAGEAVTIVYKREGFAPETVKVVPRTNNQSVHVVLKKKGR